MSLGPIRPHITVLLLSIVVLANHARAQATDDDETTCSLVNKYPEDQRLPACTRAIASGKLPSTSLQYTLTIRGWIWLDRQQWDSALADAGLILKLDNTNPDGLSVRGQAWDGKGEYRKAVDSYSELIHTESDSPDAQDFYRRGSDWLRLGDLDNAIADFSRAIQIKADFVEAYNDRGLSHARKQDWDTAIQDYSQALRIKPDYTLSLSNRAKAYEGKQQNDSAVQDYTRIIQLEPDDAGALSDRCADRAILGQLQMALDDCNHALRVKNDSWALSRRGFVHLRMKDFAAALVDYNASLALDPTLSYSLYGRGLAEFNGGNKSAADADMAAAQKLQPDVSDFFTKSGFSAPNR